MPRLAEGEFALVHEHLDQALQGSNDPVRWGSAVTDLDYEVLYADASARARDRAGLENFVQRAEEGAERLGHRLYQGIARRAHGVLLLLDGQPEPARGRLDQALAVFESMGTRWQIGLTLAERATACTALGDLASARADWQRALASFEAIGARPAAERARQGLAALG